MRPWTCALLAMPTACAIVGMAQERRLAPADLTYTVGKILVVPFAMTDDVCKDDLDRRARKEESLKGVIADAPGKALQAHHYAVAVPQWTPDQQQALRKVVSDDLCNGRPLGVLPPEVMAMLDAEMAKQGAEAALVGGISSLRWHLAMDADGKEAGVSSSQLSAFTVRGAAALYDARTHRVIWNEQVDSKQFLSSYDAAIGLAIDFGPLSTTDAHGKMFYDFPPPTGAAPAAQAAN